METVSVLEYLSLRNNFTRLPNAKQYIQSAITSVWGNGTQLTWDIVFCFRGLILYALLCIVGYKRIYLTKKEQSDLLISRNVVFCVGTGLFIHLGIML